MEQLTLRISRPYHNICALDSQTIEVHGLIKGLQVHLAVFPDIMFEMDIVVIDVPNVWGMLLNRKAVANLGGSLQMDLSYATLHGEVLKFAYRLEFDATNNVVEYEALLLDLELCRDRGIKCLNIKGDPDLVIQQLKNRFACRSERLKRYRNAIWNLISDLDAIDLIAIPREQNSKVDELAVAASTLQLPENLIDENISVEVIFRPLVPDNMDHWQVFDDDKQMVKFLLHIHEFLDLGISLKEEGSTYTENDDEVKALPKQVVSSKKNFDRQDGHKQKDETKKKLCDYHEVNIRTSEEPRVNKSRQDYPYR
jgi:ribonuclease HI